MLVSRCSFVIFLCCMQADFSAGATIPEIGLHLKCRDPANISESMEDYTSSEYEDCDTFDGLHQAACSEDIPVQIFKEEFSSELVTDYFLGCCKEGADEEEKMKLLNYAHSCRSTSCQKNSENPCSTLSARYVNGTRLDSYEVVAQDTCWLHGEVGEISLCCLHNSMEKVIRSLMGAEPQEFPHQVFIDNGVSDCGGTIYNDQYVITAAHCLVDKSNSPILPHDITVMAGSNIADIYNQASEYAYKVRKTFIHPEFTLRECENGEDSFHIVDNDIALVLLSRKLKYSERIRPLEIAPEDFDPSQYSDQVLTVGWGVPDGYKTPLSLLKGNQKLRPKSNCAELTNSNGSKLTLQMDKTSIFCSGGVVNDTTEPFSIERREGDSGGPVICADSHGNAVLCGVLSVGGDAFYCSKETNFENCVPSIHTNVSYHRDWIAEIAGKQNRDELIPNYPNGKSVPWSQFLHQVLIRSQGSEDCAGTLIQPDVVVTAAHCVFNLESRSNRLKENLEVLTGTETLKVIAARTRAKLIRRTLKSSIVVEARYKRDIAVLILEKKTRDADKYSNWPKMSLRNKFSVTELAFPKTAMEIVHLVQRNFTILSKAECKSRLEMLKKSNIDVPLGSDEYCGIEKYSGGSTCDRTLGGGVFCQNQRKEFVLCGVQTHRACEFSVPAIFIDLSKHTEWMQRTIGHLKAEMY